MQNSSTDELNRRLSRFLTALYPMTPMRLWLVVSWPDKRQLGSRSGRSSLESKWDDVRELQNARQYIRTLAGHHDIYIGVGLRHPSCVPDPKRRGRSQDVYALPGLWIEFDHRDGVHTATNLPTSSEVLAFIETLPIRFSLLIDSGGGMHCYLLFRELWILETPEQQQAAKLLRDFQYTIRQWAGRQGWHVDATDDLARVLRPAGTLNHKGNDLRPISILRETGYRVNPSEIGEAPWLQDAPAESPRQTAPDGSFPLARLEPITDGCAWICHCRGDAATLSEPEWYVLLSLLVRCEDGEAVAHQWSRPYPRYNSEEIVAKLAHALRDAGPRTCVNIREIGGEPFCSHCPDWERITSPIVLGTTSPSTRSETTTRDRSNSRSNQQTRVSRPAH
jgi:putative DNA primase/helicase